MVQSYPPSGWSPPGGVVLTCTIGTTRTVTPLLVGGYTYSPVGVDNPHSPQKPYSPTLIIGTSGRGGVQLYGLYGLGGSGCRGHNAFSDFAGGVMTVGGVIATVRVVRARLRKSLRLLRLRRSGCDDDDDDDDSSDGIIGTSGNLLACIFDTDRIFPPPHPPGSGSTPPLWRGIQGWTVGVVPNAPVLFQSFPYNYCEGNGYTNFSIETLPEHRHRPLFWG